MGGICHHHPLPSQGQVSNPLPRGEEILVRIFVLISTHDTDGCFGCQEGIATKGAEVTEWGRWGLMGKDRVGRGGEGGYLCCAAQQIALSAVLDVPVVQDVASQERWHF